MKNLFASAILGLALAFSARAADVSVKLTDVHLCCQSCVKGVQKAVGTVPGATAAADMDEGTVTLTGPDTATVQKAVDALTTAGYFGKSSDPSIKVNADTGAKDQKVQSLQVEGVHLCCGKCVKSVNEALGSVAGVTTNTAAKGAKSFTVTGNFNDKEVFDALQKAGLTGKVGQ
jgi:periplasmic mercuric ion binding protein